MLHVLDCTRVACGTARSKGRAGTSFLVRRGRLGDTRGCERRRVEELRAVMHGRNAGCRRSGCGWPRQYGRFGKGGEEFVRGVGDVCVTRDGTDRGFDSSWMRRGAWSNCKKGGIRLSKGLGRVRGCKCWVEQREKLDLSKDFAVEHIEIRKKEVDLVSTAVSNKERSETNHGGKAQIGVS